MENSFKNSAFKWSFSTLGCPDLSLDQALHLADKYDIPCIEIRALSGSLEFCDILDSYILEQATRVQSLRKQKRIVALNTSFCIADNNEESREALIRTAKIADQFGIDYLRVFGGFPFSEDLCQKRLDLSADALAWFDKVCKEKGIDCKLILEIHDGYSSADRCLELMDFAGRPVDILWDVHHSYFYGKEAFEYTWDKLGPFIKHVHVKDGIPSHDSSGKATPTLPGQGELAVKNLLKLLKENRFAGPVSLEWEKHWHQELPELELALKAMINSGWLD